MLTRHSRSILDWFNPRFVALILECYLLIQTLTFNYFSVNEVSLANVGIKLPLAFPSSPDKVQNFTVPISGRSLALCSWEWESPWAHTKYFMQGCSSLRHDCAVLSIPSTLRTYTRISYS